MLEEEEVQQLYDDILKSQENLSPDNEHFKTVYESQIYVLKKVLQQ